MRVYDGCRRHNYECLGEVCCTVQAFWGTGGGNMPIVLEEKSIIKESFDDDINDKNLCVNGKKVVE